MSDIIRLLPDSVANQIAAGEVIQRPASVIKELVENSIDAGATTVDIILKDAGRTLIQIVDNGCGMSDTDARMAFERHATSKIKDAADLFALRTMGFRGEALASVAAIAQLDVRTMMPQATVGTRLIINGSKVESQSPEACAPGTNIMVKNLFFNVPARRKFLKKDAVEMSNTMREFERLALVNPSVEFNLTHNGMLLHNLRRASFKQRIGDLFGKGIEKQLIEVKTSTSIISISGFIGLPENARRRNALQYLMVNGRNMRHPYFHKAILSCYESLITPDSQPNYFITMQVDPDTIDVNIHPTKNEIKFENETAIWQILTAAVREALGRFSGTPGMDFEAVDTIDIPPFNPDALAQHDVPIDPNYNPFNRGRASSYSYVPPISEKKEKDWEKLFDEYTRRKESESRQQPTEMASLSEIKALDHALDLNDVIQLGDRYIVTSSAEGLMIVDQRRAHMLVLYTRFRSHIEHHDVGVQKSIFPDSLLLSPAQNAIMESLTDILPQAGFEVSKISDTEWAITGAPSVLKGATPKEILTQMIENVIETGEDPLTSFYDNLARMLAEKGAVAYGKHLSHDEMTTLLSDLLTLPAPTRNFDGKKVMEIIPADYLTSIMG